LGGENRVEERRRENVVVGKAENGSARTSSRGGGGPTTGLGRSQVLVRVEPQPCGKETKRKNSAIKIFGKRGNYKRTKGRNWVSKHKCGPERKQLPIN